MNYGEIKKCDIANGEGVRVSLFVSGCTHHCKGCFNSATWDFDYGKPFTAETEEYIIDLLKKPYISGFTLLGGEPMEPCNQRSILPLLKRIRSECHQKNIWCYTGYLFDKELLSDSSARCEVTDEILNCIDVIVDGRFIEELKDISLAYKGSSNQRIVDVKASLEKNIVVLWNTKSPQINMKK